MKKIIKEVLGFMLVKWFFLSGKKPDAVLSITFHKPSTKMFRDVLAWLRRHDYRVISLAELEVILEKATVSGKVAFITIDDGWRSNLALLPVLEAEKVPVAIFIPTEPVESGNYWWEYAKMDSQGTGSVKETVESYKSLPDEIRLQKVAALKTSTTLSRSCVSREELAALANCKWVTIGSHTVNHPILKHCSLSQQELELNKSRQQLGEWLAKPIEYFAYPNGDYNADTLQLVKESGYRLCFTDRHGEIDLPWINKMEIPRNSLNDDGGYYENYSKFLGIWQKVFGEN